MEYDPSHQPSGQETPENSATQPAMPPPNPPYLPYMTYLEAVLLSLSFVVFQITIGIAISIAAVIVGLALGRPMHEAPTMQRPELLMLANVVAVFPLLVWGWWRSGQTVRGALGLTPFRWAAIAALVPLGVGTSVLVSEADNLMRWLIPDMPTLFPDVFEALFAAPLVGFLIVVVMAPVTEEFLFRGVMLRGLLRRHGTWGACVVSALLFGLIHLNPPQILAGFLGGLLLAAVHLKTGSVWPCVWLHAVYNAVPMVAYSLIPHEIQGFTSAPEPGVFQPLWLNALGVVLFAMGAMVFVLPNPAARKVPRKGYTCD